jgi:hypothetical protein
MSRSLIVLRRMVFLPGLLLVALGAGPASDAARHGSFLQSFDGPAPALPNRSAHVKYDFDPANEKFLVHVPPNYEGKRDFGLLVFIPANNAFAQLPAGWDRVLAEHHLMLVAPQAAGNDQPNDRRYGLAVLGADEMLTHYRIDPSRIYAAGFSGGARIANHLGFYQNDVFHGTIQNCGADFYRHVPQTNPPAPDVPAGDYGVISASPEEISSAKQNVRFALITGSRDFRHGNILDIYQNGYAAEDFNARLFDVPNMSHAYCDAATLSRAIDFIDQSSAPSPLPGLPVPTSRPSWLSPPASRPASRAATGPATDDATRAAKDLAMARNYLAAGRKDLGRARLRKIVQSYPETAAGREAQSLLQRMDE